MNTSYDEAHSPYLVTTTSRLYCFADGCAWTAEHGGDDALHSWNEHHEAPE